MSDEVGHRDCERTSALDCKKVTVEGHTKQAQQVLATIHIAKRLASMVANGGFDHLMDFVELRALEAIQQNAAEGFVEVLLHARDDFFEDVGVCGAGAARVALCFVVLVEELGDGDFGGHGHEFLLFGHLFPVVHEDGFEGVGDEEPYGWSADKVLFLREIVSMMLALLWSGWCVSSMELISCCGEAGKRVEPETPHLSL